MLLTQSQVSVAISSTIGMQLVLIRHNNNAFTD
jgi:hypothetical protein